MEKQLRQRLITEYVKVESYWWVPPRMRDSLSCCLTTNQEFATDPEDKPTSRGGDGV